MVCSCALLVLVGVTDLSGDCSWTDVVFVDLMGRFMMDLFDSDLELFSCAVCQS